LADGSGALEKVEIRVVYNTQLLARSLFRVKRDISRRVVCQKAVDFTDILRSLIVGLFVTSETVNKNGANVTCREDIQPTSKNCGVCEAYMK